MSAWLFSSDVDLIVRSAAWATVVALLSAIILFLSTLGLRLATNRRRARHAAVRREWGSILAAGALSRKDAEAISLPKIRPRDRDILLEEWNTLRDLVDGAASDNLGVLARRLDIPHQARRLLRNRRLNDRLLAVQTLGHLGDQHCWDTLCQYLALPNTSLSISAALALAHIDPARAANVFVPLIPDRRDWPQTQVARILRVIGVEQVSEPLYRTIRAASDDDRAYLLQFTIYTERYIADALATDLLSTSNHPGVLAAALKRVSGHGGIPRLTLLVGHKEWYVRIQVARALGRMGQREHFSLLKSMLRDREWWVRYRAARSIVRLPFVGPNMLRRYAADEPDPYARDILHHAMAEVGLQ